MIDKKIDVFENYPVYKALITLAHNTRNACKCVL